jgi:uncharacterized protein YbjT (DUF2867 family)
VRALVERLPVIVAPRWVETLAQPIAIEDVIEYLLAVVELEQPVDAVYEIGGTDQAATPMTCASVTRSTSGASSDSSRAVFCAWRQR